MKRCILALCGYGAFCGFSTLTGATASAREFAVYVQQAWPKQSVANEQIAAINQTFGTDFDDWGDVANLSVGGQLLWEAAPGWKLGLQVDYARGSISDRATVPTEAGPAKLSFEQKYDLYLDFYAVTKWSPRAASERMQPFVYAGLGVAYESDKTTLRLENDYVDAGLAAENDGWFPTYTIGLGVDVPLSAARTWFFEAGIAYVWAHMSHQVPVTGDLAPSATATADTDLTGPNYWLGIGRSF